MTTIEKDIEQILDRHKQAGRDSLIPVLQEIQEVNGFLSREAVVQVGRHLNLPTSKIYGVATFYNQFRFHAPGQFHIQVCRGTACHVKGSEAILDAIRRELKIDAGETTRDGLFSLEAVACIGACGLAPAICINGEFHVKLELDSIKGILDDYRGKAS